MSRTYEVSLQINAALGGQFSSLMRQAQSQINRLGNEAQLSAARASRSFRELEQYGNNLNRLQGQVLQYRNLNSQIAENSRRAIQARTNQRQLLEVYNQEQTQLERMRQSLDRLRQARRENRSAMSADQYRLMGEQIRQARGEIQNQQQAVTVARQNYNRANSESNRLNQSLRTQQSQLQSLSNLLNQAGISTSNLASHEAHLRSEIENTNSALQRQVQANATRASHANASQNLSYAVGNFQSAMDLGKTILSPITSSVSTFANFDATMSKVSAITGSTGKDLEALQNQARNLGATTQFSASEAAEGMTYLGMAGWTTNQILNGMPAMLNLAAAGGTDLARTADIVSDGMTAFGYVAGTTVKDGLNNSVEAAQHFADVMAATSSSANTNVEMMGETFKYAGAVAGSLGYSIDDVALATGLMANAGVKGSMAGTALRSTMTRLVKPPAEAAKALENLGVSAKNSDGSMKPFSQTIQELRGKFKNMSDSEKAAAASSIAGQEAMAGFLAMMNASDEDFSKLQENIKNSSGAAEKMSETMSNNFSGSMKSLESAGESIQISLGKIFEPAARGVAEFATEAARSLDSFIQKNPQVVQAVGTVATAISGLIVSVAGFSVLSSGINFLKTGFDLMKSSAMSTAQNISSAFSAISSRATQAATSVRTFWAANTMSIMASSAANSVRSLGSAFLSAGRAALTFIFSPIGAVMAALGLAALYVYNNWSTLSPVFSQVASILGGTLSNAVSSVVPAIQNLMNAFSGSGALSQEVAHFQPLQAQFQMSQIQ